MSVIAGIITEQDPDVAGLKEHVLRLIEACSHCPADDIRYWHSKKLVLGSRNQWITPESVNEILPRYDASLQLAIAADAILDNREQLFNKLHIPAEARHGMTDSELIMLAYTKWGQDSPKHLIGDFVFILWDEKRNEMFGARDLAGSRTLYYYHGPEAFAFCSLQSPLFALPYIPKHLNENWLAEFLAIPLSIDSSDAHSTVYRHIHQVPPGHSITLSEGRLTLNRYSTFIPKERIRLSSDQEYEEAFRDIFHSAVTSKLRTRKQVGATLSGGLDSGSVASFAARALQNQGKRLYTYSSVPVPSFEDWTAPNLAPNERSYIEDAVAHIGNIDSRYLDFEGRSPLTEVEDWLDILESPYKFFENSFWIKGIYEQASRQDIGILLTGARGNNSISWGSMASYCAYLLRRFALLRFYRQATLFSRQMRIRRSRLFPMLGRLAFPSAAQLPFFKSSDASAMPVAAMIHPDFAQRTDVYTRLRHKKAYLEEAHAGFQEEREQYFDDLAVFNLQGTSSAKLSARYGIWERDPTADVRVVRFCLSIPLEQFVKNGISRSLIRRSTAGYLPDQIRLNQRIRGVQAADWMHRIIPDWPLLLDEIGRLCRDPLVSSYLNVSAIRQSWETVRSMSPKPALAADPNVIFLMRCLIVSRFLRRFA
ncbi:asparagine synthase-related protein [Paenibacillus xylaniclasticus]|uniref:asparagine synthase-related protein n=1 Tax=Paenibacillus xylaniclasticus TaxID=588083 RepID=UPI000FDBB764|nr:MULTISPECIES: asparagine synthase-related protein [Paenibacillus]GFN31060.1 asparagine synthetase B [Paenibacillus curdlanolyticus]